MTVLLMVRHTIRLLDAAPPLRGTDLIVFVRVNCRTPLRPNLVAMSTYLAAVPASSLDSDTIAEIADDVPGLIGDLRSDHAGETGAVAIYLGILGNLCVA